MDGNQFRQESDDEFRRQTDQDSGSDQYPEMYSCWDDFEYMDTFLPRNFDF